MQPNGIAPRAEERRSRGVEDVGPVDVTTLLDVLAPYGFSRDGSLPLVSVCRDELMTGFVDAVTSHWGRSFDLSSLGGLPLLGRTGLAAALGHAPDESGRHRLVVLAFPHVGVDADDGVGAVRRPGVPGTTTACGAVEVARRALHDGVSGVVVDPHDVEESLLLQRLRGVLGSAPVPSLADLTELVRTLAVDELRLLLDDLAAGPVAVDAALLSGVVIHLRDRDVATLRTAELRTSAGSVDLARACGVTVGLSR